MKTPQPQDLMKAEKQVLTGVYVRLLKRYIHRFPAEEARALAGAVTNRIFCMEPAEASMAEFVRAHEDLIGDEIGMLSGDREIRRVVTDTVVLKVVYLQRQRSCREGAALGPVDLLKQMGVFLEGEKAPTPAGFLQTAKAFYEATPW